MPLPCVREMVGCQSRCRRDRGQPLAVVLIDVRSWEMTACGVIVRARCRGHCRSESRRHRRRAMDGHGGAREKINKSLLLLLSLLFSYSFLFGFTFIRPIRRHVPTPRPSSYSLLLPLANTRAQIVLCSCIMRRVRGVRF